MVNFDTILLIALIPSLEAPIAIISKKQLGNELGIFFFKSFIFILYDIEVNFTG